MLLVGSGFERKGLDVLLRAVPHVGVGGLKVVVAGKGESRRYSAFIRRAGTFGRTSRSSVPAAGSNDFYAASDIFVLPTLYDPFSNATIEAMAAGLFPSWRQGTTAPPNS
ncbi:MAG: glycosyltransferase [Comamonadaceae bacterium]|nr:glycosyltransferase [Comamonadaceae bacterium]